MSSNILESSSAVALEPPKRPYPMETINLRQPKKWPPICTSDIPEWLEKFTELTT